MTSDTDDPTHLPRPPGFPPGVHLIGGRNSAPVHRQNAREFYAPILPIVVELHGQGHSLRAIARELNRRGIEARQGRGRWSPTQVKRVLARAQAEAAAEASRVPQDTAPPASTDAPAESKADEDADFQFMTMFSS